MNEDNKFDQLTVYLAGFDGEVKGHVIGKVENFQITGRGKRPLLSEELFRCSKDGIAWVTCTRKESWNYRFRRPIYKPQCKVEDFVPYTGSITFQVFDECESIAQQFNAVQTEEVKMANNHLLELLQKNYYTIGVRFKSGDNRRSYTYKVPKDVELAVGDEVVVQSPHDGCVVVQVVDVQKRPRIDSNAAFTYKWIVQKVDIAAYEARVVQENEQREALEDIQRQSEIDKKIAAYRESLGVDTEARASFDKLLASIEGA